MSDVLIHVSSRDSAPLVAGLAAACARARLDWCCFFTNDGVRVLDDAAVARAVANAARAVACEKSWEEHKGGAPCPVELGSQTINSALMAEAAKVVSF